MRKPITRSLLSLMCLALFATLGSSCGDSAGGGEDVFYVYVINGYAGGGELSVYGSSGPLATGLKFGDQPKKVEVDRTKFDGTLRILLSGAQEPATVSLDAFAFYPDETVTLFLTRRSGNSTYDLRVMRHNQLSPGIQNGSPVSAPAADCVLQLYNGLSLSNVYSDNSYDIQVQWNFPSSPPDLDSPIGGTIYNTEQDRAVLTQCGPKAVSDFSGVARSTLETVVGLRQDALGRIAADPWYYAVRGPNGSLSYRWGVWANTTGGNNLRALRSSYEFQQCIAGAIQVPVEMSSDGQINCDATKFATEAQVDAAKANDCLNTTNYSGLSISPDDEQGQIIYYAAAGNTCTNTIRVRTRNVDLIFDVNGEGTAPGAYPQFPVNYPKNTWQHIMLFGSPVNPLLYTFNSGDDANHEPVAKIANPVVPTDNAMIATP